MHWLLAAAVLAQSQSLLGDLNALDRELAQAELKVRKADEEQAALRRELARLEVEMASARVRQQEAHDAYKKRVRALARMPVGARLMALGGSASLSSYLSNSRTLRLMVSPPRHLALP